LLLLIIFSDLYGNDEGENEQPAEENDSQPAPEHVAQETPAVKAETPEIVEKTQTNGIVQQPPSTNGLPQSTYTQPAPQQIPTYEQPLPNEYREMPIQRAEGGYQNIATAERSVRPSEMKDEG